MTSSKWPGAFPGTTGGRRTGGVLGGLLTGFLGWAAEVPEAGEHLWSHDLDLRPALIAGSGDTDWAGALRWRGRAGYDHSPWHGPWVAFASATTRGTVATHARAHSENLTADLGLGGAVQIQRAAELGDSPPTERDADAPATDPPAGGGFRWGRIELSARIGVESDQAVRNAALSCGPQIGYFHNNEDGLWPLVPSLFIDFQQVDLLRSEYYESLGLDPKDSSRRLSVIASWQLPLGSWLSAGNRHVRALGAVANLRYTLASGTPDLIEARREDESLYVEAGLNYELSRFQVPWVRNVHVTVGHGRLPQVPDEQTQVFLGVTLGWDKPGTRRPHRL